MASKAAISVVMAVVVFVSVLAMAAVAQQSSGVRATNNQYNPEKIGWSLYGASTYCATYDGDMPLEWRRMYKWTAFCGPSGPPAPQFCGQCLKVTNEDGGAQVIVRIVDQCSNGGLDLETSAFNQIDTDGKGQFNGHLFATYEFVAC